MTVRDVLEANVQECDVSDTVSSKHRVIDHVIEATM
jgi:hypothetical protein